MKSFQQAELFIEKALQLSDSPDIAIGISGFIYLLKRQHDDALKAGERAITLNPNGAEVHMYYAHTLLFTQQTEKAIRLAKKAFRLNPIPPLYYHYFLGLAYRNDGQYGEAINICKKALNIGSSVLAIYLPLVSSCVLMNRLEDAKKYAIEFIQHAPKFSLSFLAPRCFMWVN